MDSISRWHLKQGWKITYFLDWKQLFSFTFKVIILYLQRPFSITDTYCEYLNDCWKCSSTFAAPHKHNGKHHERRLGRISLKGSIFRRTAETTLWHKEAKRAITMAAELWQQMARELEIARGTEKRRGFKYITEIEGPASREQLKEGAWTTSCLFHPLHIQFPPWA